MEVLHVDDDAAFVDLVKESLEREDDRLTVLTATSGEEALGTLAEAPVDCIVSDYDMPGMNGLEFLERVRESDRDVPFILFTGKGSEEVASEAFSAGATDYLQKDAKADLHTILANRIGNYVETARARNERQRRLDAIATAREGISIVDEDGYFIYSNPAYAELYGYEADELVGEHFEITYPESEVDFAYDVILPTVEETGRWQGETTGVRADGSTFVEDHVVAATSFDERVCTVRDVTEQNQRERDLNRYRAMVDAMLDAVCIYDANGRIQVANEYMAEFIGTTPAELEGEPSRLVREIRERHEGDPFAELVAGERDELVGEHESSFRGSGPALVSYRLTRLEIDGEFDGVVAVAWNDAEESARR